MYYLPLLIVCSLSPGFTGDEATGPTCIKIFDAYETHYLTLTDCAARVRQLVEGTKNRTGQLAMTIPGPWRYSGKCIVEVIDETT